MDIIISQVPTRTITITSNLRPLTPDLYLNPGDPPADGRLGKERGEGGGQVEDRIGRRGEERRGEERRGEERRGEERRGEERRGEERRGEERRGEERRGEERRGEERRGEERRGEERRGEERRGEERRGEETMTQWGDRGLSGDHVSGPRQPWPITAVRVMFGHPRCSFTRLRSNTQTTRGLARES
ncbi:hypothetical protein D4764_18G0012600 [Takifugu flavidus]|uniref:Uncharacterized protein n=1 Tax=Takifugu flavidus TaxID=433684 RepID=A0A5C6NSK4_9TELE|nr:hypothetical protein D4764_18G0012600 [Takifugu flavidus]